MHKSQHHPTVIVDMTPSAMLMAVNLVPSLNEALSTPTELTLYLLGLNSSLSTTYSYEFFLINELTSAHAHNTTPTHMDGMKSEYWGVRERGIGRKKETREEEMGNNARAFS
jgi:hypothetical protein